MAHISNCLCSIFRSLYSALRLLELIGLWCTTGGAVDVWEFIKYPDILYGPMGHEDLSKWPEGNPRMHLNSISIVKSQCADPKYF